MRINRVVSVIVVLLGWTQAVYGLAMERIGPDLAFGHPTVEQPGWATGLVTIARNKSRVYSLWVNGNEDFYFNSTSDEIAALLNQFSAMRLRDHVVRIKAGQQEVTSFKMQKIVFNMKLHVPGGISLASTRDDAQKPETHEPVLTIFVGGETEINSVSRITIPDNLIIHNDVEDLPVKGKVFEPQRRLWHAKILFDDGTPAADFEHGVVTSVTLWQKDVEGGFALGHANWQGRFIAAFSVTEIAELEVGTKWLTMTVGDQTTKVSSSDPRLSIKSLTLEEDDQGPVLVEKPK